MRKLENPEFICVDCKHILELNEIQTLVCPDCNRIYHRDSLGIWHMMPSLPNNILHEDFYEENYYTDDSYDQESHKIAYEVKLQDFIGIAPNNMTSGKSCLDIGCGQGSLLYAMSKFFNFVHLYGLEISVPKLKLARKKLPKAILIKADAQNIPLANNSIDCIILADILEHLENPKRLLKEAIRCCRKYLFIRVPLEWNPERLLGILFDFYYTFRHFLKQRTLQRRFHPHIQRFSIDSFMKMIKQLPVCIISYSLPDNPYSIRYKEFEFPPPSIEDIPYAKGFLRILLYYATLNYRRMIYRLFPWAYCYFADTTLNLIIEKDYESIDSAN